MQQTPRTLLCLLSLDDQRKNFLNRRSNLNKVDKVNKVKSPINLHPNQNATSSQQLMMMKVIM